jgi:hypothetical protein
VHWLVRCQGVCPSAKLAQRYKAPHEFTADDLKAIEEARKNGREHKPVKTLIETKGNGFIIIAPSNGRVHPSGGSYQLVTGGLRTIATITPEEREALHALARTFDEMPEERVARWDRVVVEGPGLKPGDDFNSRATWEEILEPAGWVKAYTRGEIIYWRRPGKDRGWSGTTGVCKGFKCFSTSTPLSIKGTYTKFGLFAALHHQGDFQAAAKDLGARGYGSPSTPADAVATNTAQQGPASGRAASTAGNNQPVKPDQVLDRVKGYLDGNQAKALFADVALVDAIKALERADPIEFAAVEVLFKKHRLLKVLTREIKQKSKPPKRAQAAPPAAAAPGTQRPEIEITTQRHEVTRQALAVLTRDQRLYLRGEALATVYKCPESSEKLFGGVAVRNANGAARIKLLTEPTAGCFLTENTSFYRMVELSGEWVSRACHPPDWLVRSVLAWHERPGFRFLFSVAACPYVGRDGSLVSREGYDEITGTVLTSTIKLGTIPDHITKDQVTKAVERLKSLVSKFPFEDEFSFAVWLAALLTAIQRPMIAGSVPGFAFIGNKPGCGKGLLIEVIGRLVFGGPVPAFQYPEEKTESEKVMVSLALGGVQAVHFDNLAEGDFYGNSSFDSALTCLVKGGRILGGNVDANVPLRPWWVLSGNNLAPGREAYRRWLPCNLVTALEAPHERRDVSSDELRTYVTEHRAEILTDALTILLAHARAGRPTHQDGLLGSFEEWDGIVRAAVHFATRMDCLATQRRATDDSPDRLAKLALLEAWYTELPDQDKNGYTAYEARKYADEHSANCPGLHEVLLSRGQKGKLIESTKLAYVLRAMKNTNIGRLKFVDTGVKRGRNVAFKVIRT